MSHFFQLVLPSMFPLLLVEFDVSFAALGALGDFYFASGITQFAAGFAVDRFGAPCAAWRTRLARRRNDRREPRAWHLWLYPIAALMGVGNGVFHPRISRSLTQASRQSGWGTRTARTGSAATSDTLLRRYWAMRWVRRSVGARRWRSSASPGLSFWV
jgi:hypothetical protein